MPPNPAAPARTYLDAWHEMLDADPDDFATRALMADWYADQGDTAAEDCLRWQVRERKRPLPPSPAASPHYWYDGHWHDGDYDPASDLPHQVFRALPGPRPGPLNGYAAFPTRRAAEDALLAAWRELVARDQAPGSARLTNQKEGP